MLTFDHYTITVKNIEISTRFYADILGLTEIENRTRKPYIRWFSMGKGSELHVVEGNPEIISTNVRVHLALRLKPDEFDGFMEHLTKEGIILHNSKGEPNKITVRADGVRQVYFTDPDGYWIEINGGEI
ncbi:MAG: VOC family protein [Balneolales bacterium]|nr:VOC family protein [Balneolales bacterium]